MQTVSITQAKLYFYEIVEKVMSGETVVITKYGKPVSKLEHFSKVQKLQKNNF